jgi:hypothetical protein
MNRVDGSGLIARMRFEMATVTSQPAARPAIVEQEETSPAPELADEAQPPT